MRALIVDDERLARKELCRLLAAHPEVTVAGEARNAEDALAQTRRLRPDLLFLDVQMPGGSGFDVLEQLVDVPPVIFTTAYDKYALRAFEVSALDYLLKPIVPERLAAALDKVRNRMSEREDSTARTARPFQQVFVKDGDRCWFVRLGDIALLESEGNYTRLYFGQERPLILKSLNSLEERLDPSTFFRASRKQIVNLRWIESVDTAVNGGLVVTLRGGLKAAMSRRQSQRLKETMSL